MSGTQIERQSTLPIERKSRGGHRRVRTSDVMAKRTFYGEERPILLDGKVIVGAVQLPLQSSCYSLKKNEKVERVQTGQQFDENDIDELLHGEQFTSSSRYDIGIAMTTGKRMYMEDTVMVKGNLFEGIDYIAVFDGHNGKEAAVMCLQQLHTMIKKEELEQDAEKTLIAIFNEIHSQIITQTDSGTTASIALLTESSIILATCGDSPVYVKKGKEVTKISIDDNTTNEQENERIIQNGGTIVDIHGVKRVNSCIVVTRSIGDKLVHPPLIADPHVMILNYENIDKLLIASDGIVNVDTNSMIELLSDSFTADQQAQNIRNAAFERESQDNISVIVVKLN